MADEPGVPDAARREALLDVLADLIARGGAARFLAEPIRPGRRAFPEPWRATRGGVAALLRRLAWYAELDDRAVVVENASHGRRPTERVHETRIELSEIRKDALAFTISFIGDDDIGGTLAHEIGVAWAALHRGDAVDPYRTVEHVTAAPVQQADRNDRGGVRDDDDDDHSDGDDDGDDASGDDDVDDDQNDDVDDDDDANDAGDANNASDANDASDTNDANDTASPRRLDGATIAIDPERDLQRGSIAAVYLGLGVLAANAAYQQYTGRLRTDAYAPATYDVLRAGYVKMSELAFLLAVQAAVRGRKAPPDGLSPPQRDEVGAWLAVLAPRADELRERLGIAGDDHAAAPRTVERFDDIDLDDDERPRKTAFRWHTGRGWLGLVVGTALGATSIVAAPRELAFGCMIGAGLAGHLVGRRIDVVRCSNCATVLPAGSGTCRACGAALRGDIQRLADRLDAEEQLAAGGHDHSSLAPDEHDIDDDPSDAVDRSKDRSDDRSKDRPDRSDPSN